MPSEEAARQPGSPTSPQAAAPAALQPQAAAPAAATDPWGDPLPSANTPAPPTSQSSLDDLKQVINDVLIGIFIVAVLGDFCIFLF